MVRGMCGVGFFCISLVVFCFSSGYLSFLCR